MYLNLLISSFLVILPFTLHAQRIEVVVPSVEDEIDYVWRNIQDISFFEANGYDVSLPEGKLIERLKKKSKVSDLTESDLITLSNYMISEVYDSQNYQSAYNRVLEEITSLDQMINEIIADEYPWKFKVFDHYQIVLTLYGPGGSYNPENGSILLFTTTDGKFKQYENPLNTLIHEIVHIGIEESIIQPYQIPHGLKERIVDLFVSLNFSHQLPEYRIQDMGDSAFDQRVGSTGDLVKLDSIIEEFMQN